MRKVVSCLDVESVTCMPSSADTFSIASGLRRKLFRRFSVSMLADEATAVVPRSVDTAPKPHDKGTWTWMGPIISLTVLQLYTQAQTCCTFIKTSCSARTSHLVRYSVMLNSDR
jgi:hypothetical protein